MSKLNFNASYTYYLKNGLVGNLGHKPELGKTKEGEPYAKVTLYGNFTSTEQEMLPENEPRAIPFIVTFFGSLAEKACDVLNAGDFVAVYPNSIRFTKAVDEKTGERIYLFLVSVVNQDHFTRLGEGSKQEKSLSVIHHDLKAHSLKPADTDLKSTTMKKVTLRSRGSFSRRAA